MGEINSKRFQFLSSFVLFLLFTEFSRSYEIGSLKIKESARIRRMEDSLETLLLNSYKDEVVYEPPSQAEIQKATELFHKLLTKRNYSAQDVQDFENLNLFLRDVYQDSELFAVVSEFNPEQGKGHGFYAIKLTGMSSGKILQAPHRPSDLYTHTIVFNFLISSDFDAAGWSTTHRDNIDPCKETESYFNAFTVAAAQAFSVPKILQLHGFSKESHETEADVIFSSSLTPLPNRFEVYAECIRENISTKWKLFKFPEDIQELGGLLNINAKKFYETNEQGYFFHTETSKELRERLRIDPTLRESFITCF